MTNHKEMPMTYAEEFKKLFDEHGVSVAHEAYGHVMDDYIFNNFSILANFRDGSTFRYYI
jgi:hypothetical protein